MVSGPSDDDDESLSNSYSTGGASSNSRVSGGQHEEQENLLSFSSFPLGEAFAGHRVMCVQAFRLFLSLGTNQGSVALVDRNTGAVQRTFRNHSDPISDISCSVDEDFIGACDKAGFVSVQSLADRTDTWRKQMDVPLNSLAIHPHYGAVDDRPTICAGADKVYLLAKLMFLSHRRSTVIWERHGKVHQVRWSSGNEIIAWLCDRGLCLYHYPNRTVLRMISRPPTCVHAELYPSTLLWEDSTTLLLGWGNWVRQVNTVSSSGAGKAAPPLPSQTENPYRVCGLAPFGRERYLILACTVETEGVMNDLEVRVVQRDTLTDIYRGRMMVDCLHPLQLGLTSYIERTEATATKEKGIVQERTAQRPLEGTQYFVTSIDTIVKALPCDEDDHVDFLLRTEAFEEAYQYALTHRLYRYTAEEVGELLAEELLQRSRFEEVAYLIPFLRKDTEFWESWIYRFDQHNEAWRLAPVLPCNSSLPSPRIDPEYYDVVLLRCLERDPVLLKDALSRLMKFCNVSVITAAVDLKYQESRGMLAVAMCTNGKASVPYRDEQVKAIGEAYGTLLSYKGRQEDALQVLLQLKESEEIFAFIDEGRLENKALLILPDLFECSATRTVKMLLDHVHEASQLEIPTTLSAGGSLLPTDDPLRPEAVVKRLERADRRWLWVYLEALHVSYPHSFTVVAQRHAQLVATLYIEYDRPSLLAFLKEMSMFLDSIHNIYALCKKYNLVEEVVFLMFRMGKEEEGLRMIVEHLKNTHKAIQYVNELPSKEDRTVLFRKLVQLVVQYNAVLPVLSDGRRYCLHATLASDTYASVAAQYNLSLDELVQVNTKSKAIDETTVSSALTSQSSDSAPLHFKPWRSGAALRSNGNARSTTGSLPSTTHLDALAAAQQRPPTPCIVPLHLISDLLVGLADPAYAENVAIDAAYLIRFLPSDELLPEAGLCIADVTRSRADEKSFLHIVVQVAESDLSEHYYTLLKQRRAAVRVDPKVDACPLCQQGVQRGGGGAMAFRCRHVFHPTCVIQKLASEHALNADPTNIDPGVFLENPQRFTKPNFQKVGWPQCRVCTPAGAGNTALW